MIYRIVFGVIITVMVLYLLWPTLKKWKWPSLPTVSSPSKGLGEIILIVLVFVLLNLTIMEFNYRWWRENIVSIFVLYGILAILLAAAILPGNPKNPLKYVVVRWCVLLIIVLGVVHYMQIRWPNNSKRSGEASAKTLRDNQSIVPPPPVCTDEDPETGKTVREFFKSQPDMIAAAVKESCMHQWEFDEFGEPVIYTGRIDPNDVGVLQINTILHPEVPTTDFRAYLEYAERMYANGGIDPWNPKYQGALWSYPITIGTEWTKPIKLPRKEKFAYETFHLPKEVLVSRNGAPADVEGPETRKNSLGLVTIQFRLVDKDTEPVTVVMNYHYR